MSFTEIIPRTSLKNIWDSTVTPLIYPSTPMLEPVWPRVLLLTSPPQLWGPTPTFQLSLGSWPCHSSLPLCRLKPLLLMEVLYLGQRAVLCPERQPRNRHSLNWSTHSFQSWVFWGDEIASYDDKEKNAIQLLRLWHIKKKHIQVKKNAENVIRLNKRS